MKAFKNVKIYLDGQGIVDGSVAFDEKIISTDGNLGEAEIIDLPSGATVLPGFIDTHIHGAGGSDAMDANKNALSTIAVTVAAEGTTTFLATTMTQSPENITAALTAVREYREENRADGARLYGVHLEGPFIAPKFRGAQPIDYIAEPNIDVFNDYYMESGECIRIVTLAPEMNGASELISHLNEEDIIASVGHSAATNADVLAAIRCGLKNVTHTYNAQSPLHHREIGVVGSALFFDRLRAEVILDGIHVSAAAAKLLIKSKPHDKVVLITDAMRAKGLADGVSELGGQKVIVKNGEARLNDGTLAGSVLKMNVAIKNGVELCELKLESAVDFATINPAKELGIDGEYGSIAVGKRADFAVIDESFNVIMTVRDGNIIYKA